MKKIIAISLVFVLNITSFAAIISDNDGTAFVTKGEFDTLKNGFAQQITDYNKSIDSKIDGAIAEYISGISTTPIETKKILYPCGPDDVVYCMKKNDAKCKCTDSFPNYTYYGLFVQVNCDSGYTNYNYAKNKFSSSTDSRVGIGARRIFLTSSDDFVSDFVWDRYAYDVKTTISCFAYTNTYRPGAWGDKFTIYLYDAVPNLTGGSGYYPDFNAIQDFVYFDEMHNYAPGETRWPEDIHNYLKGDKVASNQVLLTKGTTQYNSAVVWETGTDRYVCTDDPHWVNTTFDDGITQAEFSRALTWSNAIYCSQSGGKTTSSRGKATTLNQTLTGQLPEFGMLPNRIDMADVKNQNKAISYDGGRETLTDIKLINGIPLLYEEKDKYIEWTPQLLTDPSVPDYNFYFSMTKFTGPPDPSMCIEVSVDGGAPTKSPVVKSGQKLSFTMPSDGVVWLKWSDSTGTGGGELKIGDCSEYKSIDRS